MHGFMFFMQEIWTLCRIFKRNVSHRRYTAEWREVSTKKHPIISSDPIKYENDHEKHDDQEEIKGIDGRRQLHAGQPIVQPPSSSTIPVISTTGAADANDQDLFGYGDWDDELRSVVELALHPSSICK